MFIHPAIKHYKELWRVEDRARSGCLKSVRAEAAIKIGKSALETGHVPKAEHNDPIKSCLVRDDLHMRAHLRSNGHLLTPALKDIRCTRAKRLFQWHAKNGHKNILLTDEKIFTIEKQYNKIYAQTSLEVRSQGAGGHHPSYVMVCWGVSHQGVTPRHFCEKHVKTGARMYQKDLLQGAVKCLNTSVFNGQKWVFQQDLAPAHKAKNTQEWLQRNVLALIRAEDWPSESPGLNPLDYKLWAVLEDMACQKRHNNLDSLKRSLVKAAAEIPLETVRTTIAEWPKCLKACIRAQGGHFE